MSQEREIEFKEIPNTYRIFTDKVTVLERKVLFEKTEESNYFDPFEDFFGGQVNTHILTLNDIIQNRNRTLEQTKPKVLFEKHQTKRLPEDYENQVKKMVDNLFSKAITRRVLVEKTGYYTYKTFQRYDAYITNLRDKDESNYWELRKKYRESIDLRLNQERNEMTGDLHRLLNND